MTRRARRRRLDLIVVACLVCAPRLVGAKEQQRAADYAALSGMWKGHFTILQRGRCAINRGGRSDFPVRFALEVAADGSFQAGGVLARINEAPKLSWRGQFQPDLTLALDAPGSAVCGDERREYRLAFTGKVTERKGKQQLELAAEDPGCPEMKCVFKHVYKLKRD